jgi:predicted O-methyltransferase YrrM
MILLEKIEEQIGTHQYMTFEKALFMRDFLKKNGCRELLEIGFFKGKSSTYFAAILEELGEGHLVTIDMQNAKSRQPNINELLSSTGLSHRVTPVFAERSFTWELRKLILETPRPQFDFCFFDGGHTWDVTGFGFLLVDILLKPGGWIIFDDMNWTIDKSLIVSPNREKSYIRYSSDEKSTPGVRSVYELIAPHLGYGNFEEIKKYQWGIARKPL